MTENFKKLDEGVDMPTFSDNLQAIPSPFICEVLKGAKTPEQTDSLFLGAVTTMSACLPNVYGIYDGLEVYPNLYLFTTADAACGKGHMNLCRKLVDPIQKEMEKKFEDEYGEYEELLYQYRLGIIDEKPEEPIPCYLYIPANSSATAFCQALANNCGTGVIFETEGDTLSTVLASGFGQFSDVLRKAFHHEPVSYKRRTGNEYVKIENPRLSIVLAGTPNQLHRLLPSSENGLFSRFMFYKMNSRLIWHDVFLDSDKSLVSKFESLGERFLKLYEWLKVHNGRIQVVLAPGQIDEFNAFFTTAQNDLAGRFGNGIVSSVRRMGLILFRICMVLTVLRAYENDQLADQLVCSDADFKIGFDTVKVLLRHTASIYMSTKNDVTNFKCYDDPIGQRDKLYQLLPDVFNTQQAIFIAHGNGIPGKSCERYLTQWVRGGQIVRIGRGQYSKLD